MNHIRLHTTIATVLLCALTAVAQQSTSNAGAASKSDIATLEEQLKVLTEKLDLSSAQQAKFRPIVKELHDETLKLMEDKTLSPEERLAKVGPWRYGADRKMRAVLNGEQKKKLDAYEQSPQNEMHGNLNGASPEE